MNVIVKVCGVGAETAMLQKLTIPATVNVAHHGFSGVEEPADTSSNVRSSLR